MLLTWPSKTFWIFHFWCSGVLVRRYTVLWLPSLCAHKPVLVLTCKTPSNAQFTFLHTETHKTDQLLVKRVWSCDNTGLCGIYQQFLWIPTTRPPDFLTKFNYLLWCVRFMFIVVLHWPSGGSSCVCTIIRDNFFTCTFHTPPRSWWEWQKGLCFPMFVLCAVLGKYLHCLQGALPWTL